MSGRVRSKDIGPWAYSDNLQTRSSDNDESTIVYSPVDDQVEEAKISVCETLKPATSRARGRKDCEAWLPAVN